jgi:hypothetical protein
MLTHLPVNGEGDWATREASESFQAEVAIAEPSQTYEI